MTGPHVLSADSITANEVRNNAGEDLGSVEDLMIDLHTGHVRYAVLSFGGVLGIGDKLFAVPFSALEVDTDEHCFVLGVDKSKLENAPGFDKDDWPDFADQTFTESIDTYYE